MKQRYSSITSSKDFEVPVNNIDDIFSFYEKNLSFKRRHAFGYFFNACISHALSSISTKRITKNNQSIICTVEFNETLHRIEWIREILSRINLEKVHEIKFFRQETAKHSGQLTSGITDRLETRIVLQSELLTKHDREEEFNAIAQHLGQLPEDIRNSEIEINQCIDLFRSSNNSYTPLTCLDNAYDQILLWCRSEKRNLLDNEVRNELFEKLIEENKELFEWVLLNEVSSSINKQFHKNYKEVLGDEKNLDYLAVINLKAFISHAMFIANKIKCSKYVPNREAKYNEAHKMWKEYVISKRKKRKRRTQREMAEEIGVSLGTLNSWFKEFKNSKEYKVFDVQIKLEEYNKAKAAYKRSERDLSCHK